MMLFCVVGRPCNVFSWVKKSRVFRTPDCKSQPQNVRLRDPNIVRLGWSISWSYRPSRCNKSWDVSYAACNCSCRCHTFCSSEWRSQEKKDEVTLEQLIQPYQLLPIPEEDDSEVPPKVWGNQARDAFALLKLYVQQQWDPGMLSLITELKIRPQWLYSEIFLALNVISQFFRFEKLIIKHLSHHFSNPLDWGTLGDSEDIRMWRTLGRGGH